MQHVASRNPTPAQIDGDGEKLEDKARSQRRTTTRVIESRRDFQRIYTWNLSKMKISSDTSTVLDIPPSAAAFCPSHPDYYVVGTYLLHRNDEGQETSEGPQKRTGTLILYRLNGTEL